MQLTSSSLWLSLCLLCTVWSADAGSAQHRPSPPFSPPQVATVVPEFSAGTFEELDGKILLHVKINDTLDTRLIVDSGAWTSFLSTETVQALHLKLQTSTTGEPQVEQGKLAKLTLGKATLTDIHFSPDDDEFYAAWNKAHPQATVSGLLGLDTLERYALGLDFVTHTYGLWLGGKIKPQEGENFNSIVCAPQSDVPYSLRPGSSGRVGALTLKNPPMRRTLPQAVPMEKAAGDYLYHALIQLNDLPVKAYVDTGAANLNVTDSIAHKIDATPYPAAPIALPSDKQAVEATLSYVRKFRIGSFETLLNLVEVIHRPQEDPTDTLLGVTSLTFADCRVILDFPGHTLYLSPYDSTVGSRAGREFIAALFDQGLFFSPDGNDRQTTLLIGKDSPAAKAGLQNGDALLEVNGKALGMQGKTRERGRALLEKSLLQVTVRRQGQFEKRLFTLPAVGNVALYFAGDPPPFPDEFLKPPTSASALYLDVVQDQAFIERALRLLRQEMAKYPPAFLTQNLKEIYVFKDLAQNKISVGGFGWAEHKRLYIQNDTRPGAVAEIYFSLTLHHELAHVLLANHASRLSRSRWEKLNAPTFHYGAGGLESIRVGTSGNTELNPTSWEQGFARPYGMSDFDEDFACICESLFCGDPNFWKAVDRVDILNKKVKMAIDFYQSLDATMTEAYFRRQPPLPTLPGTP